MSYRGIYKKLGVTDGKRGLLYNRERRKKVIFKLGGKCVKCGFDNSRALQVDHINGGGTAPIRNGFASSGSVANDILNCKDDSYKDKYQCLCANCNQIKRFENKEGCGSRFDPVFKIA